MKYIYYEIKWISGNKLILSVKTVIELIRTKLK